MVFVVESDGQKVVFAQDVHGPLDASLLSNRKDYRASLKVLLDMGADICARTLRGLPGRTSGGFYPPFLIRKT